MKKGLIKIGFIVLVGFIILLISGFIQYKSLHYFSTEVQIGDASQVYIPKGEYTLYIDIDFVNQVTISNIGIKVKGYYETFDFSLSIVNAETFSPVNFSVLNVGRSEFVSGKEGILKINIPVSGDYRIISESYSFLSHNLSISNVTHIVTEVLSYIMIDAIILSITTLSSLVILVLSLSKSQVVKR